VAYCGHCGARLAEGDEFCQACGTAVSEVMPLSGPWAEGSARRTGRIALIALAAALTMLVVAGVAYFGVIRPMQTTEPQVRVASTSTTATSGTSGSAAATGGASSVTTPTTQAQATQPPATSAKPKSTLTAGDVAHQATRITKNGEAGGGDHTLTLDYVQFLMGAAAETAAEARGTTADNDYYVVNDNTKLRTFPVDSGVVIKLYWAGSPTVSRIFTFAEFKSLMATGRATYGGKRYDWSKLETYYVTVKNGRITRIEQQWVP